MYVLSLMKITGNFIFYTSVACKLCQIVHCVHMYMCIATSSVYSLIYVCRYMAELFRDVFSMKIHLFCVVNAK